MLLYTTARKCRERLGRHRITATGVPIADDTLSPTTSPRGTVVTPTHDQYMQMHSHGICQYDRVIKKWIPTDATRYKRDCRSLRQFRINLDVDRERVTDRHPDPRAIEEVRRMAKELPMMVIPLGVPPSITPMGENIQQKLDEIQTICQPLPLSLIHI